MGPTSFEVPILEETPLEKWMKTQNKVLSPENAKSYAQVTRTTLDPVNFELRLPVPRRRMQDCD